MPVIEEQVSEADLSPLLEHKVKFDFTKEAMEQKLRKIMKINRIACPEEALCNEIQGEEFHSISLDRSPEARAIARKKDTLKQELLSISQINDELADSSEYRRPLHQEEYGGHLHDSTSMQKSRLFHPPERSLISIHESSPKNQTQF